MRSDIHIKPLKELAKKIFAGASLYSIAKLQQSPTGVPTLNIKDISDGRVLLESSSRFSIEGFKTAEHYMVLPGDVLIACRGTQLKVAIIPDFALGFEENGLTLCQDKACEQKNRRRIQCNTPRTLLRAKRKSHGKELETFYQNPNANSGIIPKDIPQLLITSNLIAIRLNGDISPEFLAAYLQSQKGQRALLSRASSSVMQLVLNVSDVQDVEVPVPPLSLQEKIADISTYANEQYHISLETAQLRKNISEQVITDLLSK